MSRSRLPLITFACLLGINGLGVSTPVRADDPPPPPEGWSGKGQAGYVMSRGTTDTDTANAKVDLTDIVGTDWKHTIDLLGLYGKSSGVTQAERWGAALQSNYNITPRTYAFGALHYLADEFSGFQYQGDLTAGIGYKVLTTDVDKLDVQIGVGYRRLRPEELVKDNTGAVIQRVPLASEGGAVGAFGLAYEHDFNSSTKITEKLAVDAGSGNTQIENDVALVVNMSKALALSAGYSIIENSTPPPGVPRASSLTTLNLVYAFGQK
jgi:putative salt-induced outer membrane protein